MTSEASRSVKGLNLPMDPEIGVPEKDERVVVAEEERSKKTHSSSHKHRCRNRSGRKPSNSISPESINHRHHRKSHSSRRGSSPSESKNSESGKSLNGVDNKSHHRYSREHSRSRRHDSSRSLWSSHESSRSRNYCEYRSHKDHHSHRRNHETRRRSKGRQNSLESPPHPIHSPSGSSEDRESSTSTTPSNERRTGSTHEKVETSSEKRASERPNDYYSNYSKRKIRSRKRECEGSNKGSYTRPTNDLEYERSRRTIFVSQMALTVTMEDLCKFFKSVGEVSSSRIIADRNTHRSRGIGYVEFCNEESVTKALALNDSILHGQPIKVSRIDVKKNSQSMHYMSKPEVSTNCIQIEMLDLSVTDEELKSIFSEYGPLRKSKILCDPNTLASNGMALVSFKNVSYARKVLEKGNDLIIRGMRVKITSISYNEFNHLYNHEFEEDGKDKKGYSMSSLSRIDLMTKLSRNKIPIGFNDNQAAVPPPSRNIILKNMFNESCKTDDHWISDLEEEVRSECQKYGRLLHVGIDDKSTDGSIYLKFDTVSEAKKAIISLNGRFFACAQITAAFIPDVTYNSIFSEASYL